MQSIRVASVSMNSPLGELDWVFEQIEGRSREATEHGVQLVLFPELLIHGHCNPNTWELAEPVPDGPSTQRLIEIAKQTGLVISAGISEMQSDIVFGICSDNRRSCLDDPLPVAHVVGLGRCLSLGFVSGVGVCERRRRKS